MAREAMRAAAGWFDATQSADRTVCMIDPPNTASRRVARHLGFREFAEVDYRGSPVLLFERNRPRWRPSLNPNHAFLE